MSRLELLHKFAQEEPPNPFNWYALATEYRKYSLLKALPYYEKVWQEFPDYAPNYYHLAHAYWELQAIEKAQKVFEQGIQVLGKQKEGKMLQELQNAYQNFLFENDLL